MGTRTVREALNSIPCGEWNLTEVFRVFMAILSSLHFQGMVAITWVVRMLKLIAVSMDMKMLVPPIIASMTELAYIVFTSIKELSGTIDEVSENSSASVVDRFMG